jgi:hypothetical protein
MYLLVLRLVASVAQNAAIPVFLWLLHGAERAVKRHELARAKKKGTLPVVEKMP